MMLSGAHSASAVARVSGDFYTYSLTTSVEGIEVTGDVTYRYQGTEVKTVGGSDITVNVMAVSGNLTGGISMFTLVSANVGGVVYETRDGAAIAEEDLTILANVTIGTGPFSFVRKVQTELESTYDPPLLSKFDPSSTSPGDNWSEMVSVSETNTTWINGALFGTPVTTNTTIEYNVTVADAMESITVPAGTFECLRISVVNPSGDSLGYWWSSKIGNFVRIYTYPSGSADPSEKLDLTDYNHTSPTNTMLIIVVGAAVLVAGVVVLAVVLMLMRRARSPREGAPPPLGPVPPPDDV